MLKHIETCFDFIGIIVNVVFPEKKETKTVSSSKRRFPLVVYGVVLLYLRKIAAKIETWIGVPKGAVNFDNGVLLRQEEIISKTPKPVLPDVFNIQVI